MLAVTDFPDIRLKTAIQSADEGDILLIPREGGYLVRLYVDLGEIDPDKREAFREDYTQDKVVTATPNIEIDAAHGCFDNDVDVIGTAPARYRLGASSRCSCATSAPRRRA